MRNFKHGFVTIVDGITSFVVTLTYNATKQLSRAHYYVLKRLQSHFNIYL